MQKNFLVNMVFQKLLNDKQPFDKITSLPYPEVGITTLRFWSTPIPYDTYFVKMGVTNHRKVAEKMYLKGNEPL
jgi:hypothetical protein